MKRKRGKAQARWTDPPEFVHLGNALDGTTKPKARRGYIDPQNDATELGMPELAEPKVKRKRR